MDHAAVREAFKTKLLEKKSLIENNIFWEFNDDITRARVQGMCEVILDEVTKDRRYAIICDRRNNPPILVDEYDLKVDLVYVQSMNLGVWCYIYVPVFDFTVTTLCDIGEE